MILDGTSVTNAERTFLDLTTELSAESLVVVGDGLIRAGWTSRDHLLARAEAAYRRRGALLARKVTPILDGRSQSPPESMLRFRIISDYLPAPEPQCPVTTASGVVVGHSDLGWKRWQVAAEYEGRHHADDDEQFGYDIERYTAMAAAGWIVLRAARSDLRDGSRRYLAQVRRTLASRGAPC